MQLNNHEKIFKWMINFSVLAGEILIRHRGKVSPIIKDKSNVLTESSAKTILDDIIQELFLSEVYLKSRELGIEFSVNAEEDTPLKFLFKNKGKKGALFLHLDPLDGTKSYLDMNKEFTVGMAISDSSNNFTHTVVCAPMFNKVFIASPKKCVILNKSNVSKKTFDKKFKKCQIKTKNNSNLIYEKRILSEKGKEEMKKLGFRIKKPLSAHLSIIKTALRESSAFLYGGAQIHDGFIPFAFAKARGLKPLNISGEEIKNSDIKISIENSMPVFHRVPSLCYFSCEEKKKKAILNILSVKENLHPVYLETFAAREKI